MYCVEHTMRPQRWRLSPQIMPQNSEKHGFVCPGQTACNSELIFGRGLPINKNHHVLCGTRYAARSGDVLIPQILTQTYQNMVLNVLAKRRVMAS